MNGPWIRICALLVTVLVLVAWIGFSIFGLQNKENTGAHLDGKRENDIASIDGGNVPFQFKFQICNGLTNQRLQLLDGLLVGLFLGAQIVLPKMIVMNGAQFVLVTDLNMQPMDRIFNMVRLEQMIQQQFLEFWCQRREHHAFKVWCAEAPPPAIVYDDGIDVPIESLQLRPGDWGPDALIQVGESSFTRIIERKPPKSGTGPHPIIQIREPCEFWFNVKVVEGNDFWDEFWKIHQALTFNDEIIRLGEQTKRIFLNLFGGVARDRATSMGYKLDEDSVRYGGYHVVHFRAEKDWHHHCERWFSWLERRDNCMNNTWHIGNVLLSEGITPVLPVYLATGLTESEVKKLRKKPSMRSFFEIYTVVTKGMLGLTADVGQNREYWAALDFILGEEAEWFVGNSISTFSAVMMEIRSHKSQPMLPYNGGKMALEEIDCLRPRQMTLIPPIRDRPKWLFTVTENTSMRHTAVYNQTVAAVRSAFTHAPDLIPVCVTTAQPQTPLLKQLASMGVRIIYHTPTWLQAVKDLVEEWNQIGKMSTFQHLNKIEFKEVVGQWLRIDLPVLGILDDFVLYTDVSVLFTKSVTWKDLLGENCRGLARSMQRKMYSGPFFNNYAVPGKVGVPRWLAVPDNNMAGVMLMNLKTLKESYEVLRELVIKKEQILKLGSADPCSYFDLFQSSSLPSNLSWELHQPHSDAPAAAAMALDDASIIHFQGPKCQADILPYLRHGHVRLETFTATLEMCNQQDMCKELCLQFEQYLT